MLSWLLAASEGATLAASPSQDEPETCTYAKEYITTLEYLRAQKAFSIPESEARKLSQEISRACTGSARRFIKITALLSQSGLATPEAIKVGIEFSIKSDTQVETFITVFLTAFLEDELNLEIRTALHMAHALSAEFQGDSPTAQSDFKQLTRFCVDEKNLNLPRPQCGPFSARIAHQGEKIKGGIASPFIQLYSFLVSDSGAHLTTRQALTLTEKLMEGGREAPTNFIQAFKYGISTHGLNVSTQEAIHFAQTLTLNQKNHTHQNASESDKPGT